MKTVQDIMIDEFDEDDIIDIAEKIEKMRSDDDCAEPFYCLSPAELRVFFFLSLAKMAGDRYD